MKLKVKSDWKKFFIKHQDEINNILEKVYEKNVNVLPETELIFRAFSYTSLKKCKLVILGMDPYPGKDNKGNYYAEGLAFSVNPNIKKLPGSLKNIFKELYDNYTDFSYDNGSLINWAKYENILLLNTSLTVEEGKPNSHTKYWKDLTDKIILELDNNSECIFLLMGNNAKEKTKIIKNKDRIISCVHPSPLSAYNGFFGSKIFIEINNKLEKLHKTPINWNLKKNE